jgi:hypothetical protein
MNDDVRKFIYGTVIVFVGGLLAWFAYVYVSACGFTFTCQQGKAAMDTTPVPTLSFASVPVLQGADNTGKCRVEAVELMGAWVSAGAPETESFSFPDVDGNSCEGNYNDDVKRLFVEANIWYPGSYSCAACHTSDIGKTSAANLDLSSYDEIMSGSQRVSADVSGNDILGGGNWENSLLYEYTYSRPLVPAGHAEAPASVPIVFAGKPNPVPVATPTP